MYPIASNSAQDRAYYTCVQVLPVGPVNKMLVLRVVMLEEYDIVRFEFHISPSPVAIALDHFRGSSPGLPSVHKGTSDKNMGMQQGIYRIF
jgi:hypothetical protein